MTYSSMAFIVKIIEESTRKKKASFSQYTKSHRVIAT